MINHVNIINSFIKLIKNYQQILPLVCKLIISSSLSLSRSKANTQSNTTQSNTTQSSNTQQINTTPFDIGMNMLYSILYNLLHISKSFQAAKITNVSEYNQIYAEIITFISTSGLLHYLLSLFASCTITHGLIAHKIIIFFNCYAQQLNGSLYLYQASIISYLCHHQIINHQSSSQSSSSSQVQVKVLTPQKRKRSANISAYINNKRNIWHIIWCDIIALITILLQQLGHLNQYLDQTLEFIKTYHYLIKNIIDTSNSHSLYHKKISLASLMEIKQMIYLLSELEVYGSQWRYRLPQISLDNKNCIAKLIQWIIHKLSNAKDLKLYFIDHDDDHHNEVDDDDDELQKKKKKNEIITTYCCYI